MDYYLLLEHWASLVRMFKDSESKFNQERYDSEQLALTVLDYIRYTRFKQYKLFVQKRGEEFERMIGTLKDRGYDSDAVERYLENEDLWNVTLELAEQ